MTESEIHFDHFDLDHFDHFSKSKKIAKSYGHISKKCYLCRPNR